ncbi:hypothetical protein [Thermoflavimicrobium dichotomicum]|uniref:3-oxoacyl-[acyl-carrier protein] reductase n=1 Tax=Thermoflavimicrobium dichotomicum TaxID=46223 RepID=A0A1I3UX92_9BACL|nr:hypothetical protein [Thermoflavimicrobium dichotomicum]SFJ86716.1 3-oxoacyl-[acyl-carrier protein] reductase [Thermoflavimicrobium dichotomicum]
MIIVMETWYLKSEFEGQALELMQQMDDLLGPDAHEHPGWTGHASFYQSAEKPNEVIMVYPWKSRELHEDLVVQEEPKLVEFVQKYCEKPRVIQYFNELPVEVEHDHDHHHHNDEKK